jgi:hypothetical protein
LFLDVVAANIPEFGDTEPASVEIVPNLLVVGDFGDVCAGCVQHQTT